MGEVIFIGVAWPYANGPLHLGHVAGAYLPADIFARYHRAKGDRVLMVSGSDQHGTPITLRAKQEGEEPQAIAARYHQSFLQCWEKLGISFDLFTSTNTPNHMKVTHDVFLTLLNKGYISRHTMPLPYCPQCKRYLPDRYLGGTCPYCNSPDARGDQCNTCGKPLNSVDLIAPHCQLCGAPSHVRDSEHFFLRLDAFQDRLIQWVKQQTHWRESVRHFTINLLEEGLKKRAITRDIDWGVTIPQPGFENKRIYVWFEAVIGYLSASQEWALSQGDSQGWQPFWQPGTKSYYFIGKDNIPFHTITWPAMLMGYEGLALPYDVPANEFLTLEGKQFSTSRNWAVWLPDYLEHYAPDPLRYMLSINMPEGADTDFSWRELVRRNNDELVATYGNLVHRVLTFTQRQFGREVPAHGEFDPVDNALLHESETTFTKAGSLLDKCHFRDSIQSAMSLAHEANRYLEKKSPWKMIKQDRQATATSLYVALSVISCLKTILYPFLPFSSQKLHHLLGFSGKIEDSGWTYPVLPPGQEMAPPEPLFTKLDEEVVANETTRLGGT